MLAQVDNVLQLEWSIRLGLEGLRGQPTQASNPSVEKDTKGSFGHWYFDTVGVTIFTTQGSVPKLRKTDDPVKVLRGEPLGSIADVVDVFVKRQAGG